jgi:hypothetical protein
MLQTARQLFLCDRTSALPTGAQERFATAMAAVQALHTLVPRIAPGRLARAICSLQAGHTGALRAAVLLGGAVAPRETFHAPPKPAAKRRSEGTIRVPSAGDALALETTRSRGLAVLVGNAFRRHALTGPASRSSRKASVATATAVARIAL